MRVLTDIRYSEASEACLLDLYLPDGEAESVFVYFHGGGITSGDKGKIFPEIDYLCTRGIAVVSANYRMYPAATYPEFIQDAAAVVAWVKANAPLYGYHSIYVGGSSAGGYLSMMLCFDARYLTEAGLCPEDVAGYFHDAGQPTAHFNVLKFGGTDPRRVIVDERAPLYHIGCAEAYPPMHFVVSDNDMHGRYEQTLLVLSALRHFGHTEPRVTCSVMNGKHCAYVRRVSENGEGIFVRMVYDFISAVSCK